MPCATTRLHSRYEASRWLSWAISFEAVARARCVVAEAEIALVSRLTAQPDRFVMRFTNLIEARFEKAVMRARDALAAARPENRPSLFDRGIPDEFTSGPLTPRLCKIPQEVIEKRIMRILARLIGRWSRRDR